MKFKYNIDEDKMILECLPEIKIQFDTFEPLHVIVDDECLDSKSNVLHYLHIIINKKACSLYDVLVEADYIYNYVRTEALREIDCERKMAKELSSPRLTDKI